MWFEIWYSPNEDDMFLLVSNVQGNSFEADLSEFPGSNEAVFVIFATDGARTGCAASPVVSVPYSPPVFITRQTETPEFRITEEVNLEADIIDPQDGWMFWDGLEWTLDGEHFISGNELWVWPFELPAGTHTFTLTAENSGGITASEEFTIIITDDTSGLPDDWSRDDLINALSRGFIAPLNRLDNPVTRAQFANMIGLWYIWSCRKNTTATYRSLTRNSLPAAERRTIINS